MIPWLLGVGYAVAWVATSIICMRADQADNVRLGDDPDRVKPEWVLSFLMVVWPLFLPLVGHSLRKVPPFSYVTDFGKGCGKSAKGLASLVCTITRPIAELMHYVVTPPSIRKAQRRVKA